MLGLTLSVGRVLRYTTMPEVGMRLHGLFMGGFGYVPFFIATVYQMVGLLPRNHPYLVQRNIGRYGIRHVVFEAARHLKFSLRNIDQIILFFAVIIGVFLFCIQFLAFAAVFFFQPAYAGIPTNWTGFFSIANAGFRQQDIASIMLDLVFGVPHPSLTDAGHPIGFFESCVAHSAPCENNFGANLQDINASSLLGGSTHQVFGPLSSNAHTFFPFPYHLGIHRLFAIYSNGLLVIAVFITTYFVATILAETAQSGTPFGRRFNKTWAPLRIVMAFGLLMPLTVGLNSSQYVVLYAAKYGSAFASNGWRLFIDRLGANNLVSNTDMVMTPNRQSFDDLTQFMYVARVCKQIYDHYNLVERRRQTNNMSYTLTPEEEIRPYIVGTHTGATTDVRFIDSGMDYETMLTYVRDFANLDKTDRVVIRFGIRNKERFGSHRGYLGPVCGEVILTLSDKRSIAAADPAHTGPWQVQNMYFFLVKLLWYETGFFYDHAGAGTQHPARGPSANHRVDYRAVESTESLNASDVPDYGVPVDSAYAQHVNSRVSLWGEITMTSASSAQNTVNTANLPSYPLVAGTSPLYEKGWAAAGVWYQSISDINGSLVSAAYATPYVSKFPMIMELVAEKKSAYNQDIQAATKYEPTAAGVKDMSGLLANKEAQEAVTTLWTAHMEWALAAGGMTREKITSNAFVDAITLLFGVQGLYDLRENANTHPLAMLSGVGRSLVESSIRNLGWAAAGVAVSGLKGFFGEFVGKIGNIAASFLVTVAMLGLTVGIILYYVVPFLPFLYFFFAVGGWIKGIFEALVGAPLWALAHIRIDGNGLPGQAALNGYFLIFEVFLRPILIVFGLLASISTYSALVSVLNVIFPLVSENAGGYDVGDKLTDPAGVFTELRSRIDEFFYTVLYAIIVYMLGMASFKLIDLIPNNILRWMGQSVATFGDQREDPAQGLVSRASVGSQQALSKVGGGLQGIVGLTK